jgi:hypothetical protein
MPDISTQSQPYSICHGFATLRKSAFRCLCVCFAATAAPQFIRHLPAFFVQGFVGTRLGLFACFTKPFSVQVSQLCCFTACPKKSMADGGSFVASSIVSITSLLVILSNFPYFLYSI